MAKKTGVPAGVIAGGAAAAVAAAAGAYWFYGAKDAAKHRKAAKSFMLKARAETAEAVEKAITKLGSIDKDTYLGIVDGVVKRYSTVAGITAAEVEQMTKDLKGAWKHMQSIQKTATKKAKKSVSKVKKAVKKKK